MAIERIGSILLKNKSITQEELDPCLEIQKNMDSGKMLGLILRRYNFANDEEIAKALAQQVGWRYFDKKYIIDLFEVEKLGLNLLKDKLFIPVETAKGKAFIFAHPFDIEASDSASARETADAEFYVGSESAISSYLEGLENERKINEINDRINKIRMNGFIGDELKELFDLILDSAIIQGATDIHVEPEEEISAIRFRLDGILYFKFCLKPELHNNLVNVIFNKADITVSDFLKFHDARFQHAHAAHAVDIRVSSIPSIFGPSLVLRLLDKSKTLITIEKLGFHKTHFSSIASVIQKPHGIIILTGPTGSGKTTTLYAILNQLKSFSRKIITIEDPVEIKMPLINQVQINEKQGITFAHATRAFLRHDPNVILIGEIRDADTAREAIRAAITGHKVFSTLHTNDTTDAIYRLHDLGISLEHIANSVLCVVSQRLLRKLCPYCRKRITVKKQTLPEFIKINIAQDTDEVSVYKARGCTSCRQGYRGRTVIAEVLCFDEPVRKMISEGRFECLRQKSKETGTLSLQSDASRLVLEGITSIEEAQRVAG